jgi:hypothetical protein
MGRITSRLATTVGIVSVMAYAMPVTQALAYHLEGCKFSSASVSYYNSGSGRDYAAIFDQSAGDWTATPTPVSLSRVYSAGFNLNLTVHNDGLTGYDGITILPSQPCNGGTNWVSFVESAVNNSYTTSYASSKVRSVIGHEIGHALGLAHQETTSGCPYVPLMIHDTYTRYDVCGVKTPRADDIAGINAIY